MVKVDRFLLALLCVGALASSGATLRDYVAAFNAADDATATSVLSVSGADGLTLKELAFADCTGVAVAASGTTGLTVKDCWYKAIGGAIAAVDGTYPVSIANGAGTLLSTNSLTVAGLTSSRAWRGRSLKRVRCPSTIRTTSVTAMPATTSMSLTVRR